MGDETAKFVREWNFAFLVVLLVAALLVAHGYFVLAAITGGLCLVAIVARWCAMRIQGRRFYGQEKQAR